MKSGIDLQITVYLELRKKIWLTQRSFHMNPSTGWKLKLYCLKLNLSTIMGTQSFGRMVGRKQLKEKHSGRCFKAFSIEDTLFLRQISVGVQATVQNL